MKRARGMLDVVERVPRAVPLSLGTCLENPNEGRVLGAPVRLLAPLIMKEEGAGFSTADFKSAPAFTPAEKNKNET